MVLANLRKQAWDHFIPLMVTIELTEDCNFKCVHCYNYDRSKYHEDNVLDLELLKKVLPELKEAGTLLVSFTGGEPLLYPQITEAITAAKRVGLEVGIKTNASLLNEQRTQMLADLGVSQVEISLYGLSIESVKPFTQASFDGQKLSKALGLLKTVGIEVQLNIILNKHNFEELDQMLEFCQERSLFHTLTYEITKRYDGTVDSQNHRLTDDQVQKLLLRKDLNLASQCEKDPSNLNSFQCTCARLNCAITARGIVYPCMGAPMASGDLNKKSFLDVWKNSREFSWIRSLKTEDFKDCLECGVSNFCNRSSGNIYSNTGNYTGCDESTLKMSTMKSKIKPSE